MLALLLALLLGGADVTFEQTTVVQAPGAPPGPGVKTRVRYSGQRMRLESGEGEGPAFVLRLDDQRAFRLDPARRTALVLDVGRLRARAQGDVAMAGDLMGARDARPRTRPLAKPLDVAGYACQGYRITAGPTTLDVYVTEALPVGMERFAALLEWTGADASLGPLAEALRALKGFPLETRSRVVVLGEAQETHTTVTRVVVGPVPPALFEVPPGYAVAYEDANDREGRR
ncbi:MAG TPA: DUF4412 domain-containing protein [Vicinamibacteria bacterium]|nr:DUF4412 domain-containing protein [Vicinamibacteria bacterium]